MKKAQVLLALTGLFALTGCGDKIMGDRTYIPAKDEKAVSATRQYDDFASDNKIPAAQENQAFPAPAPAPAAAPKTYSKYAPMENVKSSGGITSDAKPVRKGGRRAGAVKGSGKAGTYVVKKGDFPAKIARMHGISVTALLEANKMTMADATKLRIGQKLVIPARGAKVTKGAAKTGAAKTGAAKTSVKVEAGIYIVQPGDFPQRIARRLKVKLADLLKANNLTEASSRNLRIGQKLVVPGSSKAAQTAKADAPAKTPAPAAQKAEADKTAEGTPISTSGSELKKADDMAGSIEENAPEENSQATTDANEAIELKEDTTFKELAAQFNVTETYLRNMNPMTTGDALKKGDFVFVPVKK